MGGVVDEVGVRLNRALVARKNGRRAEEVRLLDEALSIGPSDPRALNARGMRALTDREHSQARAWFLGAAQADPGQIALWMNVATACRALADDEGERSALARALSIDRLNFMAQLRSAELYARLSERGEAATAWSNVVQMALQMEQRPPVIEDALLRGQAFLRTHNELVSKKVVTALGDRVETLGIAARRFSACVDHNLGRRAIYHNECAGLHFPFLPADEFFDRGYFPWLSEVEASTDSIRAEALALMADGGEAVRPYVQMEKGGPTTKWSPLDGSLDWSACFLWEYGSRNDIVCERCPQTAAMLARLPQTQIPGKAPSAFFSILKPGAHIPAHTGVTNTRAIVHVPLVVPAGCRFRVGGETREWREGEAFVFDDTIQHEAWNDSDQVRVILIFDVWNPHLSSDEQALLVDYFALTASL